MVTDKRFITAHWAKESNYVYNFLTEEYGREDEDQYLVEICNYTESKTLRTSPA